MTDEERDRAIRFMRRYGGSFVKALAEAHGCADLENRAKLEAAFADLFARYVQFDTPRKLT